ncbi:hypothetical protein YC2023_041363 [Brassica napus]
MSSEVRRYISMNFRRLQRLYVLSECRRKVVGKFRRAMFPRIFIGNGRRNSDDLKFFVFVGNWSEINPSQTSDDIEVRRNLRRNSACFLVVTYGRIYLPSRERNPTRVTYISLAKRELGKRSKGKTGVRRMSPAEARTRRPSAGEKGIAV